jgi:excisionase family DNA binding protein
MEMRKDLGPGLNWKQAIKLLGCSKSFFYQLVDDEEFPNAYTLGSRGVRVPQADIEAYRERNRKSG